MEICCYNQLPSTQKFLQELIVSQKIENEIAILAKIQTNGQGSGSNSWIGTRGDLFFSIAIKKGNLPSDLPLQSSSIYFGNLVQAVLRNYDSGVWLKWPNDIYLESKKVGGIITQMQGNFLILGIGLNMAKKEGFASLDMGVTPLEVAQLIIQKIKVVQSWKQIFSKYRLEFEKSKGHMTKLGEQKIAMQDAKLLFDGSIEVDGKRIFSLR